MKKATFKENLAVIRATPRLLSREMYVAEQKRRAGVDLSPQTETEFANEVLGELPDDPEEKRQVLQGRLDDLGIDITRIEEAHQQAAMQAQQRQVEVQMATDQHPLRSALPPSAIRDEGLAQRFLTSILEDNPTAAVDRNIKDYVAKHNPDAFVDAHARGDVSEQELVDAMLRRDPTPAELEMERLSKYSPEQLDAMLTGQAGPDETDTTNPAPGVTFTPTRK